MPTMPSLPVDFPAQTSWINVAIQSWVVYFVGIIFTCYLGFGLTALCLPTSPRSASILITPFIGISLIVTLSGFFVALGTDIRVPLVLATVISTAANVLFVLARQEEHLRSSDYGWRALIGLSASSYAISSAVMAHNEALAYVGGQVDIYLLIPITEWFKSHSAQLLSLGPQPGLAPQWNATLPPLGNWLDPGAKLGGVGHRFDEANFLLQRGPAYLQAALAAILGWDSYAIFRPTQALMLSLAGPASYLFMRHLLQTTPAESLLAAALVELNGTLFFWVSYGHPGQAVGLILTPVALVLTVSAIGSGDGRSVLAPAIVLSALFVSYYQGVPLALALLGPTIVYLVLRSGRRRVTLARGAAITFTALVLSVAEHVKLAALLRNGDLTQTGGWGDSQFASVGEALGTTLMERAFSTVVDPAMSASPLMAWLRMASAVATVLAVLFFIVGASLGKVRSRILYLCLLTGGSALLLALRLAGYRYGYAKSLAGLTFLFTSATVLGVAAMWEAASQRGGRTSFAAVRVNWLRMLIGSLVLMLFSTAAANLAVSAYAFWKPVGNVWDTRSWQIVEFAKSLPERSQVRISPNLLSGPESAFVALYAFRNQMLQGHFSVPPILGQVGLPPEDILAKETASPAEVEVLGSNEVAAIRGLGAADMIWSNALFKAYSRRHAVQVTPVVEKPNSQVRNSRGRLPAVLQIPDVDSRPDGSDQRRHDQLLLTMAAEAPTTIEIVAGKDRSTLTLSKGVSVRSIPVESPDPVHLSAAGGAPPYLLSAFVRWDLDAPPAEEDHSEVVAAVGESHLCGHVVATTFTYLDIRTPVSHSIDIYSNDGGSHVAWFELPTNPDERISEVELDVDASTLLPRFFLNGKPTQRQYTSVEPQDGAYVAYFTTWAGNVTAGRIPLYRYKLRDGRVVEFTSFPMANVWYHRQEQGEPAR